MRKKNVSGWVCLLVLFLGVNVTARGQSTWTVTGSMETERAFHSATTLNNGEVLVAGGRQRGLYGIPTAELYNPNIGTFSFTGKLNTGRANFTATLLQNGEVLVAGGDEYIFETSGTVHVCLASAELYNPATGTFTVTGSMHSERCASFAPGFTATLLENSQVLIAGGVDAKGNFATPELYNPSTGTFSLTGNMVTPRLDHTATLLQNGEVLIAGGADSSGYLTSAELYNPSTGTFTATGSLHTSRDLFTATLLQDGEVLVAGGENTNLIAPFLTDAELYNPSTGKWSVTGSLNNGRYNHTATLLNNGEVLIAGGGAHLASAELYNPSTGKFKLTGSLNTGRTDHRTVLLNNGEVLTTGGYDGNGGNIGYLSSAELFH